MRSFLPLTGVRQRGHPAPRACWIALSTATGSVATLSIFAGSLIDARLGEGGGVAAQAVSRVSQRWDVRP
jgi:hypothetical protein